MMCVCECVCTVRWTMYCTMFKVCNRIKHQLLLLEIIRVVKGKER